MFGLKVNICFILGVFVCVRFLLMFFLIYLCFFQQCFFLCFFLSFESCCSLVSFHLLLMIQHAVCLYVVWYNLNRSNCLETMKEDEFFHDQVGDVNRQRGCCPIFFFWDKYVLNCNNK